jgi:hypothetical protein
MCFDLIEQEIEEARVSGEHNIIKVSCDVDNKETEGFDSAIPSKASKVRAGHPDSHRERDNDESPLFLADVERIADDSAIEWPR